jgi:hypothetical protein
MIKPRRAHGNALGLFVLWAAFLAALRPGKFFFSRQTSDVSSGTYRSYVTIDAQSGIGRLAVYFERYLISLVFMAPQFGEAENLCRNVSKEIKLSLSYMKSGMASCGPKLSSNGRDWGGDGPLCRVKNFDSALSTSAVRP